MDYNSQEPSFTVDSEYSKNYLGDTYEPEYYNRLKSILGNIVESFDEFLNTHDEYSYLRSIDIDKVGVNDRVFVTDVCCTGIIMQTSIDNFNFIVNINGQMVTVEKSGIKPVDEYINKLKIPDICLLYTFIREKVDKQLFTEIEYFHVFTEYFKINEKTLYNALPRNIRGILLNALNERIGCFKKEKAVALDW